MDGSVRNAQIRETLNFSDFNIFKMLSCNIVLVFIAVFIALFVHDTGELQSLSNVHAHTNRCAVVHAASKGFEDLARFDDGTLISIAGDHTHFEFKLGTSMRAMLRAKQQRIAASGASPPPIEMIAIDAIDGVSSMVRVVNPPRDFSSHGLAARGSVAAVRFRSHFFYFVPI